jgi:hypothetical protein
MTDLSPQSSENIRPRVFVTEWDPCAIAQSRAEILREDDPALSQDEAFEQALRDDDINQFEWECMLDDLTTALQSISPAGYFYVEGSNLGWRQRSGYKGFRSDNGQAFLHQLLPQTECTFKIEQEGNTIYITNYHHDAPTGEFYTVVQGFRCPITEEIVSEKPVIDVTVSWNDWRGQWVTEDSTGDWTCERTRKAALKSARLMKKQWTDEGYRTRLVVRKR